MSSPALATSTARASVSWTTPSTTIAHVRTGAGARPRQRPWRSRPPTPQRRLPSIGRGRHDPRVEAHADGDEERRRAPGRSRRSDPADVDRALAGRPQGGDRPRPAAAGSPAPRASRLPVPAGTIPSGMPRPGERRRPRCGRCRRRRPPPRARAPAATASRAAARPAAAVAVTRTSGSIPVGLSTGRHGGLHQRRAPGRVGETRGGRGYEQERRTRRRVASAGGRGWTSNLRARSLARADNRRDGPPGGPEVSAAGRTRARILCWTLRPPEPAWASPACSSPTPVATIPPPRSRLRWRPSSTRGLAAVLREARGGGLVDVDAAVIGSALYLGRWDEHGPRAGAPRADDALDDPDVALQVGAGRRRHRDRPARASPPAGRRRRPGRGDRAPGPMTFGGRVDPADEGLEAQIMTTAGLTGDWRDFGRIGAGPGRSRVDCWPGAARAADEAQRSSLISARRRHGLIMSRHHLVHGRSGPAEGGMT